MYLKNLNGYIKNTTFSRPISLSCFSSAEEQHTKTALESADYIVQ